MISREFNESDESLMVSLVLGLSAAFEELVRRYQNRFLATAYRTTGNHEAAEDITQETFTAIWQARHQFNKNIAGFSTWAYTILRARIDKYLRDSRKTRRMVRLAAVAEDKDIWAILGSRTSLSAGQVGRSETLSTDRLAQLKALVLQYLSTDEQRLYHLKEEKGLSCEAISQIPPFKGVSVATLQKRCQRYKEKLIVRLLESRSRKDGTG